MRKKVMRLSALMVTAVMFLISAILLISNMATYFEAGKKNSDLSGGNYMASLGVSKAYLTKLTYNGLNIRGGVNSSTSSFTGKEQTSAYKDTVTYKIELPSGTSAVPTVDYTVSTGATATVANASNLTSTVVADRTTTVTVTQDNITHYYKLVFSVAQIPNNAVYSRDFSNSSEALNYENYTNGNANAIGGLTTTNENGELKIVYTNANAGNNYIFDNGLTFDKADGSFHAKVRFTNPTIQFGILVQGKDQNQHGAFVYDSSTNAPDDDTFSWHAHKNASTPVNKFSTNFMFEPNVQYDLKVQIWNNKLTARVDNEIVFDQDITENDIPPALTGSEKYKFGFRMWKQNTQTVYVDDLYVAEAEPAPLPPNFPDATTQETIPSTGITSIQSVDLKVTVGDDFPFVYKYELLNGGFLANGIQPSKAYKAMIVNGKEVAVTSSCIGQDVSSATYKIIAQDLDDPNNKIDCEFTVVLRVLNGKKFRLEFIDIVEKDDTVVRTFYFPEHSMISLMGSGASLGLGEYTGWGPMSDEFINMTDVQKNSTRNRVSYVMLNQGTVSASIENNAMDGERKYIVDTPIEELNNGDYSRRFNITNNAWHWNYLGKNLRKIPRYITPYSEVIFGGDENKNGNVDWQDSALLHREIMYRAFGSDTVKDYWSYIAMNMSSTAGNPSLRILDRAKAISYLTDGFGQKVMNKGYQVGGHDDSHGDYDNVSVQQGGKKDFEYLNQIGKKYNISTGIHINATEFALDGFETKLSNMQGQPSTLLKNWDWLDQAYMVDKEKDLSSGELERRVSELKDALPNLGWVYIDVWQSGSKYTAKNLAMFLNEAGYSVATEAAGDFVEDATLFHWNTDLYYPSGGSQSQIIRFVQNDVADKFAPDKALLSMTMPGVAGWRNVTYFDDAYQVFYRNNLAAKYMQYFTLEQWTPNVSAKFSDGVESSSDGKIMTLKKDGKVIAKIDVSKLHTDYSNKPTPAKTGNAEIFIPWSPITEEKIYYFNDNETSSTWDVPASWSGLDKAYLYKLTSNGRELASEVAIENGKCTITADKSAPYVLSKTKQDRGGLGVSRLPAPDGKWGEGSEILNFGFSGGNFESWQVSGDGVKIENDYEAKVGGKSSYKAYHDPLVSFTTAGSLNQTLKVEGNSTYSISAWVYTVRRKVTLKVTVGDKEYFREISDTDVDTSEKPSKYMFSRFQRLSVDVPVPSGVNEIQLSYVVEDGKGTSIVDDFRSWKWTTPGMHEFDSEKYLVKEDFENVDEQWGPFVSTVGYQPHIHLAQKDLSENSTQIKDYVINGQWSLKINNTENMLHMRTLPSTVNFKTDTKYFVKFNYQAFKEHRVSPNDATYIQNGFNMPISDGVYEMNLYSKDGKLLVKNALKSSTFKDTNYTYNSEPSTEVMSFEIPVGTIIEEGAYLGLYKTDTDTMAILIMDDLEIGIADDSNLGLVLGLSLGLGIPAILGGGFCLYWFLIRKRLQNLKK